MHIPVCKDLDSVVWQDFRQYNMELSKLPGANWCIQSFPVTYDN